MKGSKQKTISKNLAQMKFMQKSLCVIDLTEGEQQHRVDDEHWYIDVHFPEVKSISHESSDYAMCADLLFNRMSFMGFNPEVEKLMKSRNTTAALLETYKQENEMDVKDIEMAQSYSSLADTIGRKFKRKAARAEVKAESDEEVPDPEIINEAKKKKKFLRPAD